MTLKQFLMPGQRYTEVRIFNKQSTLLYEGSLYLMLHNISGGPVDDDPYTFIEFETWEQQQEILDSPVWEWAVQNDVVHIYIGG